MFKSAFSPATDPGEKQRLRMQVPTETTTKNLERLIGQVKKAPGRGVKGHIVEFISNNSGRKLVCEIPKLLSNKVRSSIVRQCAARYPILEPLVDIFVNSFDDKI